ncbi:MAG: response regulator transcription factor [Phycisphaerae bacterium]|nr:response regulator transcription factor [Phycisphaerae bacterium]
MATKQILVIEDDRAIREGIVDALALERYRTYEAATGNEAMTMAVEVDCDLVLLDLVLPGHSGLEILEVIRETRPTLPVIILTALGDEKDRVHGLKLGADDYVVKPFSVDELLARVQAVLRRSPERPSDVTEIPLPGGQVDLARREVRFDDGARQELSEKEASLLRYLAMNGGRAVSRKEILSRVWRMNPDGVETRTIDMHVVRLREKLRDNGQDLSVIRTVRGKGYMFGAGEVA